jgi:hypothetical protein
VVVAVWGGGFEAGTGTFILSPSDLLLRLAYTLFYLDKNKMVYTSNVSICKVINLYTSFQNVVVQ